jgi:hypothetical protein
MEFYRIKIGRRITYQEKEHNVVEYKNSSRYNKKALIAFILDTYPNVHIKDIINGMYKCIIDGGYLIGVQYDMNKIGWNEYISKKQNINKRILKSKI